MVRGSGRGFGRTPGSSRSGGGGGGSVPPGGPSEAPPAAAAGERAAVQHDLQQGRRPAGRLVRGLQRIRRRAFAALRGGEKNMKDANVLLFCIISSFLMVIFG
jgi:hypothetical protein